MFSVEKVTHESSQYSLAKEMVEVTGKFHKFSFKIDLSLVIKK
jgi:hypothetical protein